MADVGTLLFVLASQFFLALGVHVSVSVETARVVKRQEFLTVVEVNGLFGYGLPVGVEVYVELVRLGVIFSHFF